MVMWLKILKRYYEWRMMLRYSHAISLKLDGIVKRMEDAQKSLERGL